MKTIITGNPDAGREIATRFNNEVIIINTKDTSNTTMQQYKDLELNPYINYTSNYFKKRSTNKTKPKRRKNKQQRYSRKQNR